MAKLGVSSMLAVLIIGSTLMALVQPGLAQNPPKRYHPGPHHPRHNRTHIARAPRSKSAEEIYLDSIPKRTKDYIENCTKNVTPRCGEQIVGSLFNARKVHAKCCHQLVRIGEDCHKAIVDVFSGMPDVKQAQSIIKANSHKVFTHCVRLVKRGHNKPRPKPKAPERSKAKGIPPRP